MQLTTETFGNVLVVHTPDDLTDEIAPLFHQKLSEQIAQGKANVVLQMDRTDAFDSAGLTVLLDVQDELREHGGNLKVSGLVDPGRKIFEVTRLDQQLDLFDSVIDAVASFR